MAVVPNPTRASRQPEAVRVAVHSLGDPVAPGMMARAPIASRAAHWADHGAARGGGVSLLDCPVAELPLTAGAQPQAPKRDWTQVTATGCTLFWQATDSKPTSCAVHPGRATPFPSSAALLL